MVKLSPPATRTCPLASTSIVWRSRAVFMEPVVVQELVAGL